jgi:hypothetical protein
VDGEIHVKIAVTGDQYFDRSGREVKKTALQTAPTTSIRLFQPERPIQGLQPAKYNPIAQDLHPKRAADNVPQHHRRPKELNPEKDLRKTAQKWAKGL